MEGYSPSQLRGQRQVLYVLGNEWLKVAEIKARVGDAMPGRFVQYRLRELRSRGLVEYREDEGTRTGRWRRLIEGGST